MYRSLKIINLYNNISQRHFIQISQVIAGSVEAISIAVCIFVVLKMGIKNNLIAYMIVAGCACLFVNIVPDGAPAGVISLAMIG